jgi:hypothetical protein
MKLKVEQVQGRIYEPVYLPVIRREKAITQSSSREETKIIIPETSKEYKFFYEPDNSLKEETINSDDRSSDEEKFFQNIEENSIFLKDSSETKRKYLIDKIKSLLRERDLNFSGEFEPPQADRVTYVLEGAPETLCNENTCDREEQKEGTDSTANNNGFSLDGLKKKILDNLNVDSLQKLISKQKDVILSLARASKEIVNFFQRASANIISLTPEERLQNTTSLKGLLFDTFA